MSKSLDLGCGLSPSNPYKADTVFGVDLRSGLGDHVASADLAIEPIPYSDESFEYVTAFQFIEHVPRVVYLPKQRTHHFPITNGLLSRSERMHAAELGPRHRKHLGRRVELHGA